MSVSVIIPAYNEAQRLPTTLAATADYFAGRGEPFEILVVDDGSTDDTPALAAAFARAHPQCSVQCLGYGGNRGKGYAVRYGMLRAGGDRRLFCDADLSTPAEEYEVVLAAMEREGAQVGIGSRPLRNSHLLVHQPWYREWLGRGFNKAVQLLAVPGIADTQCGFKVFTAEAATDVFSRCRLDGFAFDSEALLVARRLGYTVAEVPIRWAHKDGSKISMVRDGLKMLRDLSLIRWMHRQLKKNSPQTAPGPSQSMKHEEYERMYRFEDRYWWFVARRHLIVSLLEQHYPRDGQLQILDIGCGTGKMLDELSAFGTVVGADYAPEALEFCVTRGVGAELARADVRRLPFADASFDAVTAMDIIEHIDDDKAAACEIFRVLKPGGRLLVTVPAFPSLWSEHDEALHHYRRYTVPRLKDLFQRAGLAVPRISYTVTTLFPLIWAYRQVSNLLPRRRTGGEKKANLVQFSGPVNAALLSLSQWETRLVQSLSLPFGVTVVCLAEKPADAPKDGIRKVRP